MKNKITMTLIACLFSMFQLTAQNKNSTKTISLPKKYSVEAVAFTFNVIQLTSSMNQPFEDVHSNIDYLEYDVDYEYSDTLVIVRYRCIKHSIILIFSRLEDTEQLKGCLIDYENNEQIKCFIDELKIVAYKPYYSKYSWAIYSKTFNYLALVYINKKKKEFILI